MSLTTVAARTHTPDSERAVAPRLLHLRLCDPARARCDHAGFERLVAPLQTNLRAAALRLAKDHARADDLVQETLLRAWRFWPRYVERDNCHAWLQCILLNVFRSEHRRDARARLHWPQLEAAALAARDTHAEQIPESNLAELSQALPVHRLRSRAPSPQLAAASGPALANAQPHRKRGDARRLEDATAHALRSHRSNAPTRALSDGADLDSHAVEQAQAQLSEPMRRGLARLSGAQRRVLWLVDARERSYREAAAELDCPVGTVMSRLHRARAALRAQLQREAARA